MIPKLHLALADDMLRPVMCHCLVTRQDVVASDAHILVKHRAIDLFPESFIKTIPAGGVFFSTFIMKELAKTTAKQIEFTRNQQSVRIFHKQNVKYNPNEWIVEAKVTYNPSIKGPLDTPIEQYPNYNAVIPNLKDLKEIEVIAFRASLIDRLAKAMGGDNLQLRFKCTASAIFVKTKNEDYQAVGVIMPIQWDPDK